MRFAPLTSICLALSLGTLTLAAPLPVSAQSFPRAKVETAKIQTANSQTNQSSSPDLRRRAQGSRDLPHLGHSLYAERTATGLGDVSAMASDNEGSLYILSRSKGELLHLMDRGMDGRIDTQRVLSSGFDAPTGLTLSGGVLYIADSQAIWRVDTDGQKQLFVPLTNIQTQNKADMRPLLAYENRLLLGLTTAPNVSQVLSVDIGSGVATLLTKIPEAPIRSLSYGGGQLWAATGQSLRPVTVQSNTDMAKAYPLEAGAAAIALHLPNETDKLPENWPVALKGQIIALQGSTTAAPSSSSEAPSSGGNNIVSLPTQFGAPTANLSVLVGGFSGRNGRSAWAAPSAVVMDPRGLFFADRLGGTLWRAAFDDRPKPAPRKKITPKTPEPPKQKPSLKSGETHAMSGSLINAGSALGPASTLEVGSYLKKEFEEKEAAKLAAEEAKDAAKLKAKADAKKALRKGL